MTLKAKGDSKALVAKVEVMGVNLMVGHSKGTQKMMKGYYCPLFLLSSSILKWCCFAWEEMVLRSTDTTVMLTGWTRGKLVLQVVLGNLLASNPLRLRVLLVSSI